MNFKKFLAILSFLTITALFYVHQQTLIYQTGAQLKENQRQSSKLIDRNSLLVYNILNLKSPSNLERKLQEKRIVLNMPKGWEVLRVNSKKEILAENGKKTGILARLIGSGKVAEASGF